MRERAGRGDGPFLVPISTIDWLVSRESPAARYIALRDLLGRPAKDLELRKAKQALPKQPFVRDVLATLRRKLAPDRTAGELAHPYDGGFWLTLFLAEMGCDRTIPEIQHAGDVLFARWERAFVDIERQERPPVNLRVFSAVCRALALIGYAGDARLLSAASHLAVRRIGGATEADERAALAKDLLLFAAIPREKRPDGVRRGIDFAVERAITTALVPTGAFGFPTGEGFDALELLDGLVRVGAPVRPDLLPALARVAAKADHRGRWKMEKSLNDRMPVALEREGELSRWVTVRALHVMQHFVGLSVVEKR